MICNRLYLTSPYCKFLWLYCLLPCIIGWHRKWSPTYFHCKWQACYWRSLDHIGECSTSWRFQLVTKKVCNTIHQASKQRKTLLQSKEQKLFCFSVETKSLAATETCFCAHSGVTEGYGFPAVSHYGGHVLPHGQEYTQSSFGSCIMQHQAYQVAWDLFPCLGTWVHRQSCIIMILQY